MVRSQAPAFWNRLRQVSAMALVTGLLLFWSGCASEEPAKDPKAGDAAAHGEAGAEGGGEEAGGEEGGAEEGAAPAVSNVSLEMTKLPYAEITIPAGDRLKLYGRLYDPTLKPESDEEEEAPEEEEGAATGPIKKYPLVILLHSLDGNYKDWFNFPAKLVKQGYAVFALDLRGHGKSTRYSSKRLISWRSFESGDWQMMPGDLEKVLKFFAKSEDYKQVDTTRVAIMGAALGANVALKTASLNRQPVKALVLLSPGMNYKGFSAIESILYYTNPVFIAAGHEDPTVHESAEQIFKWSQGPKSLRIYKDVGQGIDMLRNEQSLQQDILKWLVVKMPPTVRTVTPPPEPAEGEESAGEEKAAEAEAKPAEAAHGGEHGAGHGAEKAAHGDKGAHHGEHKPAH
jgi:alpha-beta hydrolase superfamily lysophospholipase